MQPTQPAQTPQPSQAPLPRAPEVRPQREWYEATDARTGKKYYYQKDERGHQPIESPTCMSMFTSYIHIIRTSW